MDGQLTASDLTQYTQVTQIIEGLLTAAAIILGGIWSYMLFVRTRQKYPRANLKHRITHRPIGNKKQLLVLEIIIENTGDVLLSFASAVARIQQVLPTPASVGGSLRAADPVPEKEKEFPWPLLVSRESNWRKGEFEIEPGESDQVTYDFFLGDKLETVRVYVYFENEKKRKREKRIGWGITTLYDLRPRSNSS